MKVFIGSSSESLALLEMVRVWVAEAQHIPIPWNDPSLFRIGISVFDNLIRVSRECDVGIFIFSEDDRSVYREHEVKLPRDNVVMEFGLFTGIVGPSNVAIMRYGDAKIATDLAGIVYININKSSTGDMTIPRFQTRNWLQQNSPETKDGRHPVDPNVVNQIEVDILARITEVGVAEMDVNFLYGVRIGDKTKVELATAMGVNQSVTFEGIITKYNEKMHNDSIYRDLLMKWISTR